MAKSEYNELIRNLMKNTSENTTVESRYSVVIASAKRARQLIDGAEPLIFNAEGEKPLSIAIDELSRNAVTIKRGSEVDDDPVYTDKPKEEFFGSADDDADESGEYDGEDDEEKEEESAEDRSSDSGEDDYESDSEA